MRTQRRALVALGGAAITVLAACSSSPTVEVTSGGGSATAGSRARLIGTESGLVESATGRTHRLRNPMAVLFGHESPLGVLTADRSTLLYNSWKEIRPVDPSVSPDQQGLATGDALGRPSVRAARIAGGLGPASDVLVADGAQTVAVDASGRVAYMKASDPDYRLNLPYVGEVMVQSGLDGTAQAWTADPQRYSVLAWAGASLLVQRPPIDTEGGGDLLALDGPGQVRVLAGGANLVAVGPDGAAALVSKVALRDDGTLSARLRVVDVRTGGTVHEVEPIAPDGTPVGIVGGGSWVGDRVVADAGVQGVPALLVLDVPAGGVPGVTAVMRIEAPAVAALFDAFVSDDGASVGAIVAPRVTSTRGHAVPQPYAVASCTVADGRCRVDEARGLAGLQAGRARNPSRPLPKTGGATLPSESR